MAVSKLTLCFCWLTRFFRSSQANSTSALRNDEYVYTLPRFFSESKRTSWSSAIAEEGLSQGGGQEYRPYNVHDFVGQAGPAIRPVGNLVSGSLENGFGRCENGFEPAADIDLGVGFATKMPGGGTIGGSQIPLDDRERLISAFNNEPMDRVVTDDPANLALKLFQTRHTFSGERWLGRASIAVSR